MLKKKLLARSREVTMPDERYRSLVYAEQLLVEMLRPGNRVPKQFKDSARMVLRHYPTPFDLKLLERAAPEVLQERMEEVHRFILQGQQQEQ